MGEIKVGVGETIQPASPCNNRIMASNRNKSKITFTDTSIRFIPFSKFFERSITISGLNGRASLITQSYRPEYSSSNSRVPYLNSIVPSYKAKA
jgi:hypothetical protein